MLETHTHAHSNLAPAERTRRLRNSLYLAGASVALGVGAYLGFEAAVSSSYSSSAEKSYQDSVDIDLGGFALAAVSGVAGTLSMTAVAAAGNMYRHGTMSGDAPKEN